MEKTRDSIIEKIRKLLALSTSPNEHEASLALAKAQELLAKYNLEMAEVEDAGGEALPVEEDAEIQVHTNEPWRRALLSNIAHANFVNLLLFPRTAASRGRKRPVHLIGRKHNISAVKEMYEWVQPQLLRLSREASKLEAAALGETRYVYEKSFLYGASVRVGARLAEAQQSAVQTQALVIRYDEENQTYMQSKYPSIGKTRRSRTASAAGYNAGYKAGDKVSLTSARSHISKRDQLRG